MGYKSIETFFHANDIFLVPICIIFIIILSFFLGIPKKKSIQFYFFAALILRLLGGLINTTLAEYYFHLETDSRHYFYMEKKISHEIRGKGGTQVIYDYFSLNDKELLAKSTYTEAYRYLIDIPTYRVPQIATFIGLFFLDNYLCISLFFSFFSFIGCWYLFKMFYEHYPYIPGKLAIAILFMPSVIFWATNFNKDSLTIGGLGIFVYTVYKIFIRRKINLATIILFIFSMKLLIDIRPFVIFSFLPAGFIWIFFSYSEKIRNNILRYLSSVSLFTILLISLFILSIFVSDSSRADIQRFSLDNVVDQIVQTQSYSNGSSTYSLGEVEPTLFGVFKLFPIAIMTTLFRPFPWELNNFLMLISGVETFFILICTLYLLLKIRLRKIINQIFSDKILLMSFLFALFFAAVAGIGSWTFGTLVRYKIPCIPFYMAGIFILMSKTKRA